MWLKQKIIMAKESATFSKQIAFALGVIVMLLIVFALFLKKEPVTTVSPLSLPAVPGNVVRVQTYGNSTFGIITRNTDRVTVSLRDQEKNVGKIRFFKVGNDIEFNYDESWRGGGTITVPEGVIIELKLDEDKNLTIDGRRWGGSGSYQIITTSTTTITINDSGITVNNPGDDDDTTPEPDDDQDTGGDNGDGGDAGDDPPPPPPPPPPPDEEDDEPNPTPPPPPDDPPLTVHQQCTIKLRQEERNECCQTLNADTPHPECEGDGYWLFNYHTRLCYYHCFHPCHIGTEEEQNLCCAEEHQFDSTPGCIGEWEYNGIARSCSYECYTYEELEEYFGEEEPETDPVSQACSVHSNPSLCCDYNLKNQLSLGPRPGFPDCLGLWEFNNGNSTCEFRCATHGEMLDIKKLLEENAQ